MTASTSSASTSTAAAASSSSSSSSSSSVITQLNKYDVLLGRDKECFNHAGNKHFRDYISSNVHQYLDAPSRADKSTVVNSLLFGIQELGGRFLKRASRGSNSSSGGWVEVEDKHARDKCSHAVRDAANTMAKRGCLPEPQAKKAAAVSTRLARVLQNSNLPKRKMNKRSSSATTAIKNSNGNKTSTTTASSGSPTPMMTTSSSSSSPALVTSLSPATTTSAPHVHPHNTRHKGVVRSVSIVSDTDLCSSSSDSSCCYNSEDESSLLSDNEGGTTTTTTSVVLAPLKPKSALIQNKARILCQSIKATSSSPPSTPPSKKRTIVASTVSSPSVSPSAVSPLSSSSSAAMDIATELELLPTKATSSEQEEEMLMNQALMVISQDDMDYCAALPSVDELHNSKCWFDMPSDFTLLPDLPLLELESEAAAAAAAAGDDDDWVLDEAAGAVLDGIVI